MSQIVLAQANPALLFEGVADPGFDGEVVRFVDPATATMSPFDLGFIRGDGIFEATTMLDHVPYALRLHVARLRESARRVDLPPLASEAAWVAAVHAVTDAFVGDELAMVKILVSRGLDGSTSAGRGLGTGVPTVWIFADPLTPESMKKPEVDAIVLSRGIASDVATTMPWLLLGAKTLSYAANMAAYREAARRGADTVFFVTTDGLLLEGPTSSIVLVKDGVLRTPAPDLGILHGTTQRELFAYAAHEGIPAEYARITVPELMAADHVFNMGGSTMQTVRSIDGVAFATDPGFVDAATRFIRTEREYVERFTLGEATAG